MYAGVNSLDNTRGLGGKDGLGALTQLRILSLPDNQIRRVDSLSGCIALQVVDLSQNYIDDMLPLTLALPTCLRALNISKNLVGNITNVLYLSALSHLMHIFVSGCTFVKAATDSSIDLIPLFAAILPELITVDNSSVSSFQRGQGQLLRNHLSLLSSMSNEQVIQYLARNQSNNSNAACFACTSDVSATPLSDFVDNPLLPPASLVPSAKSVKALAHDITRLKHKLASFASPVSAPLSSSLCSSLPSPLLSHVVSKHPRAVSGLQVTKVVDCQSQAIAVISAAAAIDPVSSAIISHHSASIISRSWRSSRARCVLRSKQNQATADQTVLRADSGKCGDGIIIERLELLEKTVAVQLLVIEKLHATLQSVGALRDSPPVWRIVADASAAATRIQSAWRGHIDREVAHVIHERKRYHNVDADSLIVLSHDAVAAAAAVTIAAFVRRKQAQDASKLMLLAISSRCLYRLVCNMADRIHSMEQRLMRLEGSSN